MSSRYRSNTSSELQECNHLFSHAERVVLCCVSPLLHLEMKWLKSWIIAKQSNVPEPQLKQNKRQKKSSLQLQKFNYFLSHAGRVVLCCVSPLLHLAVKWMKSWLIASGAYLACRLRQNQNKQLGLLSYRLCLAVVAEFLLISSAQLSEMT